MHSHTTASDGALSPKTLLERAALNQVKTLAITDHDTVDGYLEALPFAAELGIQLISGIELSARWGKTGVHIVGLNFDVNHPAMQEAVAHQFQVRRERSEKIAEKLKKCGIEEPLSGAARYAKGIVCRPHFAQFLVDAGYVKSIEKAFKRYLGKGKAGDVPSVWPHLKEVIGWITQAGGVAILAHPGKYHMTRVKMRALIEDFVALGGKGLEVVTGGQSQAESEYFATLCEQHQIYGSVGSDFHGPDTRWSDIGKIGAPPDACQPVWTLWEDRKGEYEQKKD